MRLVDVPGALGSPDATPTPSRSCSSADALLPENDGRWRVSSSGVERTPAEPDLRLDVAQLGSVYLGGFGFAGLARAFRVEELKPGAAARADDLFRTAIEPWCAEIF